MLENYLGSDFICIYDEIKTLFLNEHVRWKIYMRCKQRIAEMLEVVALNAK